MGSCHWTRLRPDIRCDTFVPRNRMSGLRKRIREGGGGADGTVAVTMTVTVGGDGDGDGDGDDGSDR